MTLDCIVKQMREASREKKVINCIKIDLQLALTLLAQGTKEGLETMKTNENKVAKEEKPY